MDDDDCFFCFFSFLAVTGMTDGPTACYLDVRYLISLRLAKECRAYCSTVIAPCYNNLMHC